VQSHVHEVLHSHPRVLSQAATRNGSGPTMHAYICGLNDMVSANREQLANLGWDKKQIHFERYD
jgi:ferredoxin-NADP reductase